MQERVITKEAKAYQKSAWAIRVIFLLAGLMIAGGGIWYVAVTGIIGRKKWDFVEYGMPPATWQLLRCDSYWPPSSGIFQNALFQL